MSLKFRLSLIMVFLVLFVLVCFSAILYFSERKVLYLQELSKHQEMVNALVRVTEESLLSQDDLALISYTFKLKDMNPVVVSAYVHDGEKFLSHTDKNLVRHKIIEEEKDSTLENLRVNVISKEFGLNNRKYFVSVAFSKDITENAINKNLRDMLNLILKVSTFIFVVGVVVALWISNSISSPVIKLSKSAQEVGNGNLNIKIEDVDSVRKRTRDEIQILKNEFYSMVEKLKKLDEMKKDFVSAVTHELKSPLSAVESYLDLMLHEIDTMREGFDDKTRELFEKWKGDINYIKQNTLRLYNFINDLLDTAKIEKGKFEIKKTNIEIRGLITETVQLFKEKANNLGINLQTEVHPSGVLMNVQADIERIKQVLANLISNALKFTPPGGSVGIYARVIDASELVRLNPTGLKAPHYDSYVLISVEDTGIGIPDKDITRIFDKFEQVKQARDNVKGAKGTGLGLYISKSIVEGHGGNIWVESKEGKGSKFYFTLPL